MLNLIAQDQGLARHGSAAAAGAVVQLLCMGALGGLLALSWRACAATRQSRHGARAARQLAAQTRWEEEGGRPLPESPGLAGAK